MRLPAIIIAAALFTAGCSTTYTQEDEDTIYLTAGLGGYMPLKQETYKALVKASVVSGKKIVIDGPMISADAFFAFAIPSVCYTERAVWSPHAISHFGLVPDYDLTKQAASMLPPALREWYETSWHSWDWITAPYVDYSQLRVLWPEGDCNR